MLRPQDSPLTMILRQTKSELLKQGRMIPSIVGLSKRNVAPCKLEWNQHEARNDESRLGKTPKLFKMSMISQSSHL